MRQRTQSQQGQQNTLWGRKHCHSDSRRILTLCGREHCDNRDSRRTLCGREHCHNRVSKRTQWQQGQQENTVTENTVSVRNVQLAQHTKWIVLLLSNSNNQDDDFVTKGVTQRWWRQTKLLKKLVLWRWSVWLSAHCFPQKHPYLVFSSYLFWAFGGFLIWQNLEWATSHLIAILIRWIISDNKPPLYSSLCCRLTFTWLTVSHTQKRVSHTQKDTGFMQTKRYWVHTDKKKLVSHPVFLHWRKWNIDILHW